jgi:hypothetical protein
VRVPALLLTLCVVLAGCGGVGYQPQYAAPSETPVPTGSSATPTTPTTATASPTHTPSGTPRATVTSTSTSASTPTPTATSSPSADGNDEPLGGLFDPEERAPNRIEVEGGTLPVNATLVYERTAALLETDVEGPRVVQLLSVPRGSGEPPEFFRMFGLTRTGGNATVAAFVSEPSTVYVNERIADDRVLVEHVLAHEYVHVVQFRTGVVDTLGLVFGGTVDRSVAQRAVVEGAATYVQERYWRTYQRVGKSPAADITAGHRNATGLSRYGFAPYRFGYAYVNASVDSPARLNRVYRSMPRTTEAILHPGRGDALAPLDVDVRDGPREWNRTVAPPPTRFGELFLRTALASELGEARAARAADGWGNDTRISFADSEGERGHVWVLRWDDAGNATEFAEAFRAWADARSERVGSDRWRGEWSYALDRPSPGTTVVRVGPPGFLDASETVGPTAAQTNATVTVRVA